MIRIMIDESGESVDWLSKYGFSFDPAIGFAGNTWAAFTPYTGAKSLTESFYASAMKDFTEDMGGTYMLETEAYDLIYDEDTNQVTGVLARSTADGTEYVINAKASSWPPAACRQRRDGGEVPHQRLLPPEGRLEAVRHAPERRQDDPGRH